MLATLFGYGQDEGVKGGALLPLISAICRHVIWNLQNILNLAMVKQEKYHLSLVKKPTGNK